MKYFCCSLLFFVTTTIFAQPSERIEVSLYQQQQLEQTALEKNGRMELATAVLPIELQDVTPFLAYTLTFSSKEAVENWKAINAAIRFSENGVDWGKWEAISMDEHNVNDTHRSIRQQQFTSKTQQYYELKIQLPATIAANLEDIQLHFFSPGNTPAADPMDQQNPQIEQRSDCPCTQPRIMSRTDWCPNGNCAEHPNPTSHTVTHLIVHHSAGINSTNDWSAIVRAIWDLHVNTNGWSDIGYNWLVDPKGVLYEGRGADVIGAHFCGQNTGTEAICVMGNFQNRVPTQRAIAALTALFAWKSCELSIDPLAASFHRSSNRNLLHVSGHRDGCSTACPGDMFYPMLPEVRQGIVNYIEEECSVMTNTTTEAINEQITIAPNPTNGAATVTIQNDGVGKLDLQLYFLTGKLVRQINATKNTGSFTTSVDLHDLPNGIYLLDIRQGEHRTVKRIVKQ